MLMSNNFIVIEGMCGSGKTTLAQKLLDIFDTHNQPAKYNHGALTYTQVGEVFSKYMDDMSIGFSTTYYLADLVQDTQLNILPALKSGMVIVQDRYINSITSYRAAYSELTGEYLDLGPVIELYLELGLLITPPIELFCLPPVQVIKERLRQGEDSTVHQFYLEHEHFIDLVYRQVETDALNRKAICVDTTKNDSVERAISAVEHRIVDNRL